MPFRSDIFLILQKNVNHETACTFMFFVYQNMM